MWFIAADDYAKQVKRSFEIAGSENHEYNIQGPEAFTFDEAGKIFVDNYKKKKVKLLKVPSGPVKFFGKFNRQMNYGANICEALNNYPEKFVSEDSWLKLGKPQISLQQWAASR